MGTYHLIVVNGGGQVGMNVHEKLGLRKSMKIGGKRGGIPSVRLAKWRDK